MIYNCEYKKETLNFLNFRFKSFLLPSQTLHLFLYYILTYNIKILFSFHFFCDTKNFSFKDIFTTSHTHVHNLSFFPHISSVCHHRLYIYIFFYATAKTDINKKNYINLNAVKNNCEPIYIRFNHNFIVFFVFFLHSCMKLNEKSRV